MVVVTHPAPNVRLRFIDATRAVAMLFVVLSHFGSAYFHADAVGRWWAEMFARIGMVASPTFIIISGVLLGVLYQTHKDDFARIRRKFVDRGLFLVFVGHMLMTIALWPAGRTLWWSFSTDAIGCAMIAGVLVTPYLRGWHRLMISAVSYAIGWLAVLLWHPVSAGVIASKELLVGTLHPQVFAAGTFPILQWFSVYLASSALGERLVVLCSGRKTPQRATCELAAISALCLCAAAVLRLIDTLVFRRHFLSLVQKYPPAPAYLLFYGGLAFAVLMVLLLCEVTNRFVKSSEYASECGRASLVIFIGQYYIYSFMLSKLPAMPPTLWPLYFVPSVVLLAGGGRWWYRNGFNGYMKLGLEHLLAPPQSKQEVRPRPLNGQPLTTPNPLGF